MLGIVCENTQDRCPFYILAIVNDRNIPSKSPLTNNEIQLDIVFITVGRQPFSAGDVSQKKFPALCIFCRWESVGDWSLKIQPRK